MADLLRLPSARQVTRRPSRPGRLLELFPDRPRGVTLAAIDAELARAEDALLTARYWLGRSRGAGYVRAVAEVEECAVRVVALEARRAGFMVASR